jgi:hypothetical protein
VAEPALAPFQAWGRKRLMADMRMRSLARIAALLTAVVSVSCTTGPTAAPTLDAVASSAPTAGPMASGTPQPTLQPRPVTHRLSEIVLPHHTVADVTVICDPYQDNSHESVCEDVIRWVIPAVAFATDDPVQRAYLRRGCAYPNCPRGVGHRETLVAVTPGIVWSMVIDNDTITEPLPDPSASWPTPSGLSAPDVQRRDFAAAPGDIRDRTPLPFCGRVEEDWVAVTQCFVDAVLEGRPAEMIELTHPIDFGSPALLVTRFDGDGAVRQYLRREDRWFRLDGSIVLREPGGAMFEQWGDPVPL